MMTDRDSKEANAIALAVNWHKSYDRARAVELIEEALTKRSEETAEDFKRDKETIARIVTKLRTEVEAAKSLLSEQVKRILELEAEVEKLKGGSDG